jgi:hypothetical protein
MDAGSHLISRCAAWVTLARPGTYNGDLGQIRSQAPKSLDVPGCRGIRLHFTGEARDFGGSLTVGRV